MAKRTTRPELRTAQLTAQQMREAVPLLERRLKEARELDIDALMEADYAHKLDDLHRRVDDTLDQVFGHDTVSVDAMQLVGSIGSPLYLGGGRRPIESRRPHIKEGVASAISTLQSAISILKERLGDMGETAATRAITAYRGLELHPEIALAASQLYNDSHYSSASA